METKRIEMWDLPWKLNSKFPAPMNETVICRTGREFNPVYRIHKGQELFPWVEYITLQEFYDLCK